MGVGGMVGITDVGDMVGITDVGGKVGTMDVGGNVGTTDVGGNVETLKVGARVGAVGELLPPAPSVSSVLVVRLLSCVGVVKEPYS